jgi:putative ABC transport system permease protein
MPAGYGFTAEPEMWVPMALPLKMHQDRGNHNAVAIGRLRPGTGVAAATAELRAICHRLAEQHADSNQGWSARLVPITEQMVSNVRPALLVLWAAVGFVLLIACANVANLLLARAAARHREIAVRTAVGAGRGRLVRQLLTESGLLAAAGGALGVVLAWGGLRLCAALVLPALTGAAVVTLDGRVLAFTAALGVAASVLAGLVPALQMSRPDLAAALREGARSGTATGASRRTRGLLVVAEVALAALLLIGAGLLLRSFVRVLAVDPGFRTARLLTFDLDLPPDRMPAAERLRFFTRVIDRLRALPGAVDAAAVSELPLSGTENIGTIAPGGRQLDKPTDYVVTDRRLILGDYLATMGIRLRDGRLLGPADSAGRQRVAVIDGAMARAAWPGEEPLGKRLRGGKAEPTLAEDPDNPWFTVVGLVASVRHSGLSQETRPQLYLPLVQLPAAQMPRQMSFVVRAAGDPRTLAAAVRAAVHEVDRDTPVSALRTLDQVVADSVASRRFNLLLLALFAGLALALSAVGIYGLTSYAVVQRTRELGLRMALGALPSGLVRLLLAEVGALAGAGLLVGLAAALALTRVMASLLFGVGSTDPVTFAGVGVGLALIALVAAWVPGRRATLLDPMVALRAD